MAVQYDIHSAGVWARGALPNLWDPYLFLQPWTYWLQVWYTTWVWGVAYQKIEELLGPKLAGVWAKGAYKKFVKLFLQLLKLATSNLVHNMSSSLPCQDQNKWGLN